MALAQFRSRGGHKSGIGILCLVAFVIWSLSGGTWSISAVIPPFGLGPLRLRPADLKTLNLDELKVIKGKMLRALQDLRLPRLTSFTAFGQEYPLPYSIKGMPLESPSEEKLGYLSGFFAGNGCASSDLSRLIVSQSVQGAEVLILFAKCFGGSIGLACTGSGASLPALQWQVYGPRSRQAAIMLGKARL